MSSNCDSKEKEDLLNSCSSKTSELDFKRHTFNTNLIAAVFAAVMGSVQFGYQTGVVNNVQSVLETFITNSSMKMFPEQTPADEKFWFSLITSIFAIGGMVGSFFAGYVADKYGRKKSMLLNNIIVLVACLFVILSYCTQVFYLLVVVRFLIGINCGIFTGLSPLYITEVAPVNLRGALGVFHQMGIVTAILFSNIMGMENIFGSSTKWHLLLCVPLFFSAIQVILFLFCPESPAFLIKRNKEEEAMNALCWLRRTNDVNVEMESLSKGKTEIRSNDITIVQLIRSKRLRSALIVAVVMQLSQQLSGINAVFNFSGQMFKDAGMSAGASQTLTSCLGAVNVVFCAISIPLMEKAGRRFLHLFGLGGIACCSFVLTITLQYSKSSKPAAVTAIIAIMLFVVFFQSGPGSIPWFITSEIFATESRSAAISIAGLVNWSGNFLVCIAYLPLAELIGGWVFFIFTVLLVAFWLFTFMRVPETKGKTIEEITALF